jgi:polyhydroxyalkanoate synthesis repressor PhaR
MKNVRMIKKYPNRRLYDTEISSYITLEDVKKLVIDGVNVKVIDARTEEDLTSPTLLQIITEQEDKGTPMFTNDILQNIIRFYGNSMQGLMSNFLDQSMNTFMQQQESLQQQLGKFMDVPTPFNTLNQMAKQNMDLYRTWQDNMLGYFNTFKPKDTPPKDKES